MFFITYVCYVVAIRQLEPRSQGWGESIRTIIEDIQCDTDSKDDPESRFWANMRKLDSFEAELRKDALSDDTQTRDQWEVLQAKLPISGKKRLPVFEDRKWVPSVLTGSGYHPDDIATWSPRLMRQRNLTVRQRQTTELQFDGTPKFLIGLRDSDFLILAFPQMSLYEIGSQAYEFPEFIDTMPNPAFESWSKKNMWHCRLAGEGSVVWIPAGWTCYAMAPLREPSVQADSFHVFLNVPFVNRKIMSSVPQSTLALMARFILFNRDALSGTCLEYGMFPDTVALSCLSLDISC